MSVVPIPLELVVSGRELTEPRLAADGGAIAYVARWGTRTAVVVRAFAEDGGLGPETLASIGPDPAAGRGLGGGAYCWTPGGALVTAATDGELWLQDGARLQRLTVHGRSCRAPTAAAGFVVYTVDDAEVWTVDLRSGGHRRLDDGRYEFCFDPAVDPVTGAVSWQAWNPPDMPWDAAVRVAVDPGRGGIVVTRPEAAAVQQPRYTAAGLTVQVDDRDGWLNVVLGGPDGELRIDDDAEHAGPTWGSGQRSYAASPDGQRVVYSRNEGGFGALWLADLGTGERRRVARGVHGGLDWVGDRLVAIRSGARTPAGIVVYDTHDWTRRIVAREAVGAWDTVGPLPEPELVQTVAPDGAVVHARRYGAGAGRLLCWVHGGPTDQWMVDWRPRITYWWSRGWDVLVVDPRGTTGHGRAYQRALNGAWGRLDVDDAATLVAAAQSQGWATPATTVAVGGSSGGLTVLGLLADHATLFAGGVTSYPVSDLRALADVTHRFEAHYTETLVGPLAETSRYRDLSPLHRADRIGRPLLLFHGTDDRVVPIAQSEALVAAVRSAGGSVEAVVYEGEGHGFRDPEHVRDEYRRTEAFLAAVTTAP